MELVESGVPPRGAGPRDTHPPKKAAGVADVFDDGEFRSDDSGSLSRHLFCACVFLLFGTVQLVCWHSLVSTIVALEDYIYPDTSLQYLLAVCLHVPALLVTLLSLKFIDGLSVRGSHAVSLTIVVLLLLVPLVPQLTRGSAETAGILLLCLITVGLGVCVGFMHTYGYSFAAVASAAHGYAGYVATGNAVAGAFCFVVFLIATEAVFPDKTPEAQLKCFWVLFVFCAALVFVQAVAFMHLSRKPYFLQALKKARKESAGKKGLAEGGPALRSDAMPSNASTESGIDGADACRRGENVDGPGRPKDGVSVMCVDGGGGDLAPAPAAGAGSGQISFFSVLRRCYLPSLNGGLLLATTLLVFPRVGPYRWAQTYLFTTLLSGTFQLSDLVSRLISASGRFNCVKPSVGQLTAATVARLVIGIPLMVVPALVNAFPKPLLFVIMALFTLSGGWLASYAANYNAESVEDPREKELAAEIFCISILGFVTFGVCGTELIPLIVGI